MSLLDFFVSNPVLIVVIIALSSESIVIARNALHPYIGNFDIALILQPLGEETKQEIKKGKSKEDDEPQIMTMAYRKEWNPMKEEFRIGKGDDAETYRRDDAKVAFLQRTHRVYIYFRSKSHPVAIGYGKPARESSSQGMDMFVAQKLWQQGIAALRQASSLPVMLAILCIVAGAGISGAVFFAWHPGFVAIQTSQNVSQITTQIGGITATYTPPSNSTITTTQTVSTVSTTILPRG